MLLSRTGGLAMAGVASVLYAGVVLGRTVLPTSVFFESPGETSALELLTMFLNAGTFLIVAIVAGGLAEQFRATSQELETQRKDLRDLQAYKDLVFQSVGTGLIALDRDHRITAFNGAAEEITGRSANETIGRPWRAIFGDGVPLPEVEAAIEASPRASTRHETPLRRPDGTTVPVRLTFSGLRSGEGARLGLIGACDDLSAIRAMEARMRQADRLATLGRMAANIAHEIRNPLASLTGAIEVLTGTAAAGEARERLSQIVVRESERLNQIITNFLEYARPAPLAFQAVNVAGALEGVLLLLEHRGAASGLKIVRAFSSPLVWRVDPEQFRQVLWNLCLNAVEAMPQGGELSVGATAVPGQKLEVWVTDSGHGIAPDDLTHVFEPFFSTKPGGTGLGLSLVHRIVQEHGGEGDVRSTPVLVITAFASTETAVEAMKLGAYDYLTKPFKVDEIKLTIANALERKRLQDENQALKRQLRRERGFENFLGKSPQMLDIFETIRKAADSVSTVLITGESGTGKELVARAIHEESPRRNGPVVASNCGAGPQTLMESDLFGHVKGAFTGAVANTVGLFSAAAGGTLFLDEVTEVPSSVQVKLLRAIQEREIRRVGDTRDIKVDVRLIAASNREVAKAVADGVLREDLFYRLNVIPIHLPPLRERREDIPLLVAHFVRRLSAELGPPVRSVTPGALPVLETYRWPGHVRELENVIERALVLGSGDRLDAPGLPPDLRRPRDVQGVAVEIPEDGLDLEATLSQIEHRYIQTALARTGGVQTRAAELLRVSLRQIRYKLQKYTRLTRRG